VKWPKKSKFLVKLPEKIEILGIFFRKSKFFVKLPKKIEILWKFALKKVKFFVKSSVKNRNFSEICPKKSIFSL